MTPSGPFLFHFRPVHGWINDPNGLIEWRGVHHLFFQYKPDWPESDSLHWGHATSTDLITWTEQPIALTPGAVGDYDDAGCLSGCAVATGEERVSVLYTAQHNGQQLPALASSTHPGLTLWTKSTANPVIARLPPVDGLTDMRDHAVVRDGQRWRQLLAAGRDQSCNGTRRSGQPPKGDGRGGLLVSYVSSGEDLTQWTYAGVLLDGAEADLPGEVWECPDLSTPPGTAPGQALVILSWYVNDATATDGARSDAIWLIGDLGDGRFSPQHYGRLDLGDRLYAPQSYTTSDGRRLLHGWIRINNEPAAVERGWYGAITMSRELSIVEQRLCQRPSREIDNLPRPSLGTLTPSSRTLNLSSPVDALELQVLCRDPSALPITTMQLVSSNAATAKLDLAPFGRTRSWTRTPNGWEPNGVMVRSVRVIFDKGLVEMFADDGSAATTSLLQITDVSAIQLTSGAAVEVTAARLDRPSSDTAAQQTSG